MCLTLNRRRGGVGNKKDPKYINILQKCNKKKDKYDDNINKNDNNDKTLIIQSRSTYC